MIDHLDRMLRQLLLDGVDPSLTIGFQPPNEDWRTKAIPADHNALNIYLVDLRENRRLRSNERTRTVTDGDAEEELSPRRVDCHYLISAWSPALVSPAVEPILDEHALLHRVATVIANSEPLVALDIFGGNPVPPGFPASLVDAELGVTLLPQEGYHKLAEFWGTMGEAQPLKPVIYIVVTLPLLYDPYRSGPIVTTRIARFRFSGDPAPGETLFEVGGFVLDAANPLPDGEPAPLAGIWVELLDPGGSRLQLAQTNSLGQFAFSNVLAGSYQLRAAALGFPILTRAVSIPAPSGEYDLTFT